MTAVTTLEIDLDQPDVASPPTPEATPFKAWYHTWWPENPVPAGIVAGVAAGTAIVMVWLFITIGDLMAVDAKAALATVPATSVSHTIEIGTTGADEISTVVMRRDHNGVFASKGELFGSEPLAMNNLASLAVTVRGAAASCRIVVDGTVVDQAEGTLATCAWTAH